MADRGEVHAREVGELLLSQPAFKAQGLDAFAEILDEGVFGHAMRMAISDKTSRDY